MRKIVLLVVAVSLISVTVFAKEKVAETKGMVVMKGNPVTLLGNIVKVGDKAENFTAINNAMEEVSLSESKGKVVILSIFPSIDTKVCAMQTAKFNQEASSLSEDVVILTLSIDLPFALGRFCAAEGIYNLTTLSDYKGYDFGYKYGFLIKEVLLLARGVVVIDKQGVIKYVEYVPNISNEPNYEETLSVVSSLLK